ncbi:TonB-dependent receptor [uncultured Sphingomonas sp.]|uniref:TonB-dependent receptor n=1 Tax=uncultured Sphingomonas sp. TaxID=158754 RepID=UPI0025E9C8A3|nr:TonB-dependent receptor [uncultured Sphingomonas sp.]
MKKSLLLTSCALFACPTTAFAQSTGTVDFENEAIVVTGTRARDVGGVQAPDTPKAKAVITQELISRSNPGQTVLDVINAVPGVSFQNNDAYGNSGGRLTIRGFDQTRVSYTLDGVQLNDSGNYEVYSNFSIDPELIDQVNVGLGSTDVDSPTASATGGTVNQRTRNPGREFGGRFVGSLGQFDYRRLFGLIDTGEFTSLGTRAFISGSVSQYDNPYNNYGKLDRKQVNAKVYQPVGSNGDFVSVAGRYNRDRNNFFGSVALRNDLDAPSGFPQSRDGREYDINYPCTIDQPEAGTANQPNACGIEFDRRLNPSNSYNVRGNSRFTLAPNLVLTVDPSFQYTKANGGGVTTSLRSGLPSGSANEGFTTVGGQPATGFVGGSYFFGRDLNGDGDILDRVTLANPSQTRTRRYGFISGLRWDINEQHSARVTYTLDRANHRQTGQLGFLEIDGENENAFPIDDPIEDANGNVVQKRDRKSYAILNQVAGEYRGEFGALTLNAGLRLPFFKRDLENYCFTTSANGFVDCFGQDAELEDQYAGANPTVQGPQQRVLKYNKLLPNVGAIYDFTPQISGFASYAKGLSVPSTDNLYNAFFFPADVDEAEPDPETTDTFDAGVRFRNSRIQAQVAGWFTKFNDRLASAYDPVLERSVYRNLGRVNKYGIDASVAFQATRNLFLYAFGSLNESKIKDNLQIGGPADFSCDDATDDATGLRNCAFTKGQRESGAPRYTFGGSALATIGLFDVGLTAKRTGPRYVYDTNLPTFLGDVDNLGTAAAPTVIYGAKAPAYWLVNLDARFNLKMLRGLETSYVQFNVYNLFDKLYVGGFGGNLNQGVSVDTRNPVPAGGAYASPGFVQIGAPRTASVSLNIGF